MVMDKLAQATEQANNYYDFAGLDKLRSSSPDDKVALKAAAKQFESIFTKMLLTSMRKASEVLESDSPFNSQSTKFYRDMHDQQLVANIAETGGLGLADMMMEQLGGTNPNYKPASIIRSDGGLKGLQSDSDKSNAKQGLDFKMPDVKDLDPKMMSRQQHITQSASQSTSPVSEKDRLFDSPISFIKGLLPHAKKVAANKGMEPLMLVAQAALETGWGQKVIKKQDGSSSFNLFGIKADSRWEGEKAKVQTLEYKDGVAKKENAFFRAYGSLEESVKDYFDFLSSDGRYKEAMDNVNDPQKYFKALQAAGYATDPNYAKKVVNILNGKVFAEVKNSETQGKGE
ncbi:MAG: flagellar protein FlgJ [Alteromonadaceae bacterium]|jgi:flagellar protein FlgJ